MKNKVIVILGQTATGKSDLAVEISKTLNGEIISADSRQVYRGLDLGSGKITEKEKRGVVHHMLDVANPKIKYNVAKYKKEVDKKIKEIIAKNKIPIICGGTGFYIDAITKNIILPEVKPDLKLRKELQNKSTEELFKMLQKLDKTRASNIDSKNKVRLIRAIEIIKTLGKVPKIKTAKIKYDFIKIGLFAPSEILQERINIRLQKRIKKGMIKEVRDLYEKEKISFKRLEELGLEYRHVALYLQNKINKKEMIENLEKEILQYAKRQMTWFKRDKDIIWLDVSKDQNLKINNDSFSLEINLK
jgi:tRNA dimethylallyltransferase